MIASLMLQHPTTVILPNCGSRVTLTTFKAHDLANLSRWSEIKKAYLESPEEFFVTYMATVAQCESGTDFNNLAGEDLKTLLDACLHQKDKDTEIAIMNRRAMLSQFRDEKRELKVLQEIRKWISWIWY